MTKTFTVTVTLECDDEDVDLKSVLEDVFDGVDRAGFSTNEDVALVLWSVKEEDAN